MKTSWICYNGRERGTFRGSARIFNVDALLVAKNVELLEWPWKRECPSDATFIYLAVQNPNAREVIKWARDHGFPWGRRTCAMAALRNDLDLLKWLREPEQQCPWDGSISRLDTRGFVATTSCMSGTSTRDAPRGKENAWGCRFGKKIKPFDFKRSRSTTFLSEVAMKVLYPSR